MENHLLFVIGHVRPSALLRALFYRDAGLTSWQAWGRGSRNNQSKRRIAMEINILGTIYQAEYKDYKDDPYFEQARCCAYHNGIGKTIVVCCADTLPQRKGYPQAENEEFEKIALRHEIMHAFLYQSGLDTSSLVQDEGWAVNEEMIDWFAMQAPKIVEAYRAAGCL